MFAEEDVSGEDASLDKLEHVARLLNSIPPAMTTEVGVPSLRRPHYSDAI